MITYVITMMFTALSLLLAFYISNRSGEKPNGNILLGLTLPQEALKDEAVTQIIKAYCKANNNITLILLPLSIPAALIPYMSIGIIYLLLWCGAAFAMYWFGLAKYYDELHDLKQRNKLA